MSKTELACAELAAQEINKTNKYFFHMIGDTRFDDKQEMIDSIKTCLSRDNIELSSSTPKSNNTFSIGVEEGGIIFVYSGKCSHYFELDMASSHKNGKRYLDNNTFGMGLMRELIKAFPGGFNDEAWINLSKVKLEIVYIAGKIDKSLLKSINVPIKFIKNDNNIVKNIMEDLNNGSGYFVPPMENCNRKTRKHRQV
jgi:hypothetical protein